MTNFRAFLAISVLVASFGVSNANAAPPKPRPGPDRAFVTAPARPDAQATISASKVCERLKTLARKGNSQIGLQIRNLKSGKVICGLNAAGMRSLASNTKIFTTAAALDLLGPAHRFKTRLFTVGKIDGSGTLRGNLFLKGGGDPALGTTAFVDRSLGGVGSRIEALAADLKRQGIRRVTGRLFADDTVFDRLRGVADSNYATSSWIGPLSGLSMNTGYTDASRARFSSDPALVAARSLVRALRSRGVVISTDVGLKKTPPAAKRKLAARLLSPSLAWNVGVTNLDSNNFFAEMLAKNLGAELRGAGTTRRGTAAIRKFATSQGVVLHPIDGSGLTRGNRSNALGLVRMLARARNRSWGGAFLSSLPVAGRSGTLTNRMRGSMATGRCRAKTGSLTGVSTLSGYCFNQSGREFAFSILMNRVGNSAAARSAQDQIVDIIARW